MQPQGELGDYGSQPLNQDRGDDLGDPNGNGEDLSEYLPKASRIRKRAEGNIKGLKLPHLVGEGNDSTQGQTSEQDHAPEPDTEGKAPETVGATPKEKKISLEPSQHKPGMTIYLRSKDGWPGKDWECILLGKRGQKVIVKSIDDGRTYHCLLYTSPSPRDATLSRMPSSA